RGSGQASASDRELQEAACASCGWGSLELTGTMDPRPAPRMTCSGAEDDMYENKNEPLIARRDFSRRMFLHVLAALVLVLVTLVAGIAGHMYFDNMEPGRALIASVTLSSGLGLSIFPE